MSIHDGHRSRLKERFQNQGLDGFTEVQVLELALFYCIPRKDTNPIAHALLEHFGGLSQVLEAPVEELKRIPGMGESSASFLHLITELGRYYMVHRSTQTSILPTLEQCAEYLVPHFFGRRLETVFLLCLDAKPSAEDIQTTRRIAMALSAVEITLADHIVVADDDYVSMAQSGVRFDDCLLI